MLQVFHIDVAKVHLNVAYVAMTMHTCFKCFTCFIFTLQMFNLDVSKVDLGGARVAIAWCYCCYMGHHGSPYVSKVYCLLLRWSPRRLVMCACGHVTTLPAGAVVCVHVGVGHRGVIACVKSMLLLLLHGPLCCLLVLRACCLLVLMLLCVHAGV
jgi:hypothetical protein